MKRAVEIKMLRSKLISAPILLAFVLSAVEGCAAPQPQPTATVAPAISVTATRVPSAPPTVVPSPAPFLTVTPTPNGLFPFVLPWDDASASVTNVSAWLDKPAGKNGFIVARDGHLFAGDQRIRFFGVNTTFSADFPTHADAEKIAARMAKFGINAVRFHHMDTQPAPNGILQRDAKTLDPDQLDRLDYFIAQLKKNGIYADLNLHVGRMYPGMPTWDTMPQYYKGVDNFDPAMIQMQRDYARDLLTHLNPYTGLRYTDDPAVAFIEINNENGLMREWWGGSLDAMPSVYADELSRQWRAWLAQKYPTNDALKQAWGVTEQPLGAEMLAPLDSAPAWTLQQVDTAKAATQIVNDAPDGKPALKIQVQRLSQEAWHVQLFQSKLHLQRDQPYTLTFWAKADAPRKIQVNAMQAHDPYQRLWSADVALTTEWQLFRFAFAPTMSDGNARITFTNLGAAVGTDWFSQASLKPGCVLGLRADESLDTLSFFKKADFNSRTVAAQRDWIRFLWQTEEKYWTGMARYLKDDLGAHALIIGTQASYSPAPIQAELDVVDNHAYWQHPRFPGKPWDPANWFVTNIPMAGVADGGNIARLALQRVAGKPYIVTEYNHPAPNTFSSEAFLLAAAYGAMQDWDGVFAFDYGDTRDDWNAQRITGYFAIDQHPTKMATLPAVAALFLRGDAQSPAPTTVASFTPEMAIEQIRKTGPILSGDLFGVSRATALQTTVALSMTATAPSALPAPTPAPAAILSANNQLTWDRRGKGFVTINTPRSKAFIGYVGGRTFNLDGIVIAPTKTMQDWAAITLTAMDGTDLKSAGHILVTATGYVENTGMGWQNAEKSTVGKDWGKAPSLVEGIGATIVLPVAANRVQAFALDECGQRAGALPVRDANGNAEIEIGAQYATLWYEIEIE